MMDCKYQSRISPYYDGEVDAGEQQQIAAHLDDCVICRSELAELQRLSGRFIGFNAPSISTDLVRQLHRQVEVQTDNNLRRVARAFLAVAACLFLGMAFWVFQTRSVSPDPVTAWETAASDPQEISTATNNTDVTMAHWIVRDLSRSSGHE